MTELLHTTITLNDKRKNNATLGLSRPLNSFMGVTTILYNVYVPRTYLTSCTTKLLLFPIYIILIIRMTGLASLVGDSYPTGAPDLTTMMKGLTLFWVCDLDISRFLITCFTNRRIEK